jgi:hypothetical protein
MIVSPKTAAVTLWYSSSGLLANLENTLVLGVPGDDVHLGNCPYHIGVIAPEDSLVFAPGIGAKFATYSDSPPEPCPTEWAAQVVTLAVNQPSAIWACPAHMGPCTQSPCIWHIVITRYLSKRYGLCRGVQAELPCATLLDAIVPSVNVVALVSVAARAATREVSCRSITLRFGRMEQLFTQSAYESIA